jgi:hypothetical protein
MAQITDSNLPVAFGPTLLERVASAQAWLALEPAAVSCVVEDGMQAWAAVTETTFVVSASEAGAQEWADLLGERAALTPRSRWALDLCAHAGSEFCDAAGECAGPR